MMRPCDAPSSTRADALRIALFFDHHYSYTTGLYFERALRQLGLAVQHFWLRDAAGVPATFDMYLRIDHGDYASDVPDHLRPSAFYMIDTHLPRSLVKMRTSAPHYDVLFCAQQEALRSFPQAVWVPVGCDAALHAAPARPWLYDIGFIGTDGGIPRKFYLQALRERYVRHYIGSAPHTAIADVYSASRLVFNYAIRNDINMRVFEALAAGRCLLTNAVIDNGFEALFRDRQHLVVYRSPQELWALMDYYLMHEEEREAIGAQGRRLVLAQHTYAHRARQMLQVLHDRLGLDISTLPAEPHASQEICV